MISQPKRHQEKTLHFVETLLEWARWRKNALELRQSAVAPSRSSLKCECFRRHWNFHFLFYFVIIPCNHSIIGNVKDPPRAGRPFKPGKTKSTDIQKIFRKFSKLDCIFSKYIICQTSLINFLIFGSIPPSSPCSKFIKFCGSSLLLAK